MQTERRNQQLPNLLYWITVIELGVLLAASIGLFFLPALTRPLWPWEIAPFNTRFMGAVYAGSMIAVALMVRSRRWSPGKAVTTLIFAFTVPALLVSFIHLSQFDFSKWSTWAWFFLYILLPINAGYHLLKYRDQRPVDQIQFPAVWRILLLIMGVLLLVYTAMMFIIPAAATSFWPWAIDAFHARMYAAMFLSAGLGLVMLWRGASAEEVTAIALAEIVFAAFSIMGLLIVDAEVQRVDWSLPGTLLWVGVFIVILVAGVISLLLSRKATQVAAVA